MKETYEYMIRSIHYFDEHALCELGKQGFRIAHIYNGLVFLERKTEQDPDFARLMDEYMHTPQPIQVVPASDCNLDLNSEEKDIIREALYRAKGCRKEAARLLGVSERTLYRKIKEYGL